MMTTDEQIQHLKEVHDKLQEGLPPTKMAIRENIIVEVGEGEYDSYPRFPFQFSCWRDVSMVKEMDAFIDHAKGKSCLLDIGSFMGIFSLVFTEINKSGIAYAIEPYQKPFDVLVQTCQHAHRIACYQTAFSDSTGKSVFYEDGGHLVSNNNSENQSPVFIQTITGDSFCFSTVPNIAPDIIKVDVEGMELKVLSGLQNIITKHKPIIFLELHFSQLKSEELLEIMKFIDQFNYRILDIDTHNYEPLTWLQTIKSGEKRIVLK